MTDDQPVRAEARTEPEEESMTQKEAAIEALDRLADQAVHTAGDERGRGAAIQDHGLVARALGAKPVERAAEVAAARLEVKQAVEEWFHDITLDDLFMVKGWATDAALDRDHPGPT